MRSPKFKWVNNSQTSFIYLDNFDKSHFHNCDSIIPKIIVDIICPLQWVILINYPLINMWRYKERLWNWILPEKNETIKINEAVKEAEDEWSRAINSYGSQTEVSALGLQIRTNMDVGLLSREATDTIFAHIHLFFYSKMKGKAHVPP